MCRRTTQLILVHYHLRQVSFVVQSSKTEYNAIGRGEKEVDAFRSRSLNCLHGLKKLTAQLSLLGLRPVRIRRIPGQSHLNYRLSLRSLGDGLKVCGELHGNCYNNICWRLLNIFHPRDFKTLVVIVFIKRAPDFAMTIPIKNEHVILVIQEDASQKC
jgi:hypothetical protein